MKVSVDISPEHTEPYAVIYTSQMTDEIQRLLEVFGNSESPITALLNEEDLIILIFIWSELKTAIRLFTENRRNIDRGKDYTNSGSNWENSLCRYQNPH